MNVGPLATLGRWSHAHRGAVISAWVVVTLALAVFAPRLQGALSGALWEGNGSDSPPPPPGDPPFPPPAPPQPSPDGHTVMLQAGALVDPTEAVRAAEDLSHRIGDLSSDDVQFALTGSPSS